MTFQYFFFSTDTGFFLQALPFALITGLIFGVIKYRNDTQTPIWRKIFMCALVCYITGLVCVTLLLDVLACMWYWLFYGMPSGTTLRFFAGSFSFRLDFFGRFRGESLLNLVLLTPFGILYPLSHNATYKRTVLAGFITVICIELLQPIFGRSFDLNDIALNTIGIIFSAAVFFIAKKIFKK